MCVNLVGHLGPTFHLFWNSVISGIPFNFSFELDGSRVVSGRTHAVTPKQLPAHSWNWPVHTYSEVLSASDGICKNPDPLFNL